MSCNCGPQHYTETASGGLAAGGVSPNTSNRYTPSGGMSCGGTAILTTSLLYDEFNAVYHLDESGNGTADEYTNSVGIRHGRGGKGYLKYVPTQTPGLWYQSQDLDGNDFIEFDNDNIPPDAAFTVSLWAKITGLYLPRVWYSRGKENTDTAEGWSIQIGHNADNTPFVKVQVVGSSNWLTYEASGTALTSSCWYHVAAVWNPGSSLTLYIDGEAVDTTIVTETQLVPSTARSYAGRLGQYFYTIGQLQELRVSPVVRSADWIDAEFSNLCDSAFYTIGIEEGASYG